MWPQRVFDGQFVACHAVNLNVDDGSLIETEIDACINKRWLVTVRKNDKFPPDPEIVRWDRSTDLAMHGVSFLLYGLLDTVVDTYFETVQCFDEFYDQTSEGIFAGKPIPPSQQQHWFQTQQALIRFHPSGGGANARGGKRADALPLGATIDVGMARPSDWERPASAVTVVVAAERLVRGLR